MLADQSAAPAPYNSPLLPRRRYCEPVDVPFLLSDLALIPTSCVRSSIGGWQAAQPFVAHNDNAI